MQYDLLCIDVHSHKGFCRWKLSSGNLYTFIRPNHAGTLRCNFRSLAGIEPAIPVQRSNQLSYRTQLSCSNHCKCMYIQDVYKKLDNFETGFNFTNKFLINIDCLGILIK